MTLLSSDGTANDINNHGDVVGQARTGDDALPFGPFLWNQHDGFMSLPTYPDANIGNAYAISHKGAILGSQIDRFGNSTPLRWSREGTLLPAHGFAGVIETDINSSGWSIGYHYVEVSDREFVAHFVVLGPRKEVVFFAPETALAAINDRGDVVGHASVNGEFRVVMWPRILNAASQNSRK